MLSVDLTTRPGDGYVVVVLPGELDAADAAAVAAAIAAAAAVRARLAQAGAEPAGSR